ncbi:glycosyltransferase [uncultured Algibacter sp.]|uniref:glycosyltransferase n=1 Tax=uncultured Algibacter sp. TaxID=298659 RepID=UPI002621FC7F|nr:glycosyltransferase [uncultured Algibacter sp.]
MRVLQLIDSLDVGGAERVAINIANGLSVEIESSFLCTTRKEGVLKESLSPNVGYLFLNKTKTIDFAAIKRLNKYVKEYRINIIHAHSSSFFLATIIRFLNPKIIIIWHDHYGNSEFLETRKYSVLKRCSKYFSHIFSVNKPLKLWASKILKFKNATYLPNFAEVNKTLKSTTLSGISGKRIVCLANLRPQKDHITLLLAFKEVLKKHPDWTLHCVGKDFIDSYSKAIENKKQELGLKESVYMYGSKLDVFNILKQAEIGVLSSKSEGLPLALLEYGFAKLAVVATSVGECVTVISDKENGLLIEASSSIEMAKALLFYIENEDLRHTFATRYNKHVEEYYSQTAQIETILKIYNTYIKNN